MILRKYGPSEIWGVILEKIVSIDMEKYFIWSLFTRYLCQLLAQPCWILQPMVAIITRKLNIKNA
jgi:hypothetical protein